jgi:hypothetical protein
LTAATTLAAICNLGSLDAVHAALACASIGRNLVPLDRDFTA